MDVSVLVFSKRMLRVCRSCTLMVGLVFCSSIFKKYEWRLFSKKKLGSSTTERQKRDHESNHVRSGGHQINCACQHTG